MSRDTVLANASARANERLDGILEGKRSELYTLIKDTYAESYIAGSFVMQAILDEDWSVHGSDIDVWIQPTDVDLAKAETETGKRISTRRHTEQLEVFLAKIGYKRLVITWTPGTIPDEYTRMKTILRMTTFAPILRDDSRPRLQFIYTKDVVESIDTFDITACRALINMRRECDGIFMKPTDFNDLTERKLSFTPAAASQTAREWLRTGKRVLKYMSRGFTVLDTNEWVSMHTALQNAADPENVVEDMVRILRTWNSHQSVSVRSKDGTGTVNTFTLPPITWDKDGGRVSVGTTQFTVYTVKKAEVREPEKTSTPPVASTWWRRGEEIGRGTYGTVYEAFRTLDSGDDDKYKSDKYIMKVQGDEDDWVNEVRTLKLLEQAWKDEPGSIQLAPKLYDSWKDGHEYIFIAERFDTTFFHLIVHEKATEEHFVLLEAVAKRLDDLKIAHGDFSRGNMLLKQLAASGDGGGDDATNDGKWIAVANDFGYSVAYPYTSDSGYIVEMNDVGGMGYSKLDFPLEWVDGLNEMTFHHATSEDRYRIRIKNAVAETWKCYDT